MSRPQRLFDLLSVLKTRGRSTVPELARELGVSPRTVHRDLAVLSDAGVALVTEPGRYGGVSLLPSGRFPVSGLSTREKDLLRVTGLDVDRATELGMEALATAALGKLRPARPEQRPGVLPLSHIVTVDNRPWFSVAPSNGDVAALAADIRHGSRLVIRYRRSGEESVDDRIVDPYGLLGRGGRWYLIADRDGIPRQYATGRLASWSVLDEPRRLRPGETLASVSASLAASFEQPEGTVAVVSELDRRRLDLAERILGSRLSAIDDGHTAGTVRITVTYAQIGGVRQLLQFGDSVNVLGPPEARSLIVDLARGIVARHEQPCTGATDGQARTIAHMASTDIRTIPVRALDGGELDLRDLPGPMLIVNVASKCGLTPQYTALEKLARDYRDRGLTVLGAPCNQFMGQEPGTPDEIAEFCSATYGVTFPLTEKLDVNGDDAHPLFAELTTTPDADGNAGDVEWNFEKFLVSKDGEVLARFRPATVPDAPEIIEAVEKAL